jgi:UDP-N-acetylmuramyl pentapeptide phosphotransferase/UDP-N-acetylglucosamine-1-phosphate transferase
MSAEVLTVIAVAAAAGVSAALWLSMGGLFSSAVLQRQNYAGRQVAIGSGLVVVLATLVVAGVLRATVQGPIQGGDIDRWTVSSSVTTALLLAAGFCLLGLLDDLVGDADRRGFRGHVGAALRGQVTTGFVKLAGGVLWAFIAIGATWGWDGLRATLLVAASANLGNLLDRAPGRAIKASVIGVAVVLVCGVALAQVAGTLVVVGAAVGVLWPDLRERCMLGDTGSNVLGAVVGLGLVAALGGPGQWAALAVVVGLNLLSEKVSFSRVIDATPPLCWFDRLGSLRRASDA